MRYFRVTACLSPGRDRRWGKHIEIHLLFTNPCRYYWGDIKDPAYLAKPLTRQRRHSFEDSPIAAIS
ncbi:exodeoxyribonuclease V subunit gamma [Escherichia coli]